ncbi:MAG: FAD-dependent oxidoreductase [Pseudomonadota bacterium]
MNQEERMQRREKVAVVGSGTSGLAAAHYLLEKGYSVDLYEKSPTIGGRMGTLPLSGKMVAFGGKNIGTRALLFRDFVKKNGNFDFEFFGSSWTREVNGKMVVYDNSNKMRLWLNFLRLYKISDLIKFGKLFYSMKNEANWYLDGPYFRKISEKFDDKPISEYFSDSFCDNFLRMLTVRMNGAEPGHYHMGNFCSNLGMVKVSKNMEQLAGNGMHDLLNAFVERDNLEVRTGITVLTANTEKPGQVDLVIKSKDKRTESLPYRGVILALTASHSAKVLNCLNPRIGQELSRIKYNPVGLAIVKYSRAIFTEEQRSISFDKDKVLSNAGCYGVNDLDIVRYTFSGGAASREINAETEPDALISSAENLLNRYFKVSSQERIDYIYKFLDEGLCSYAPYHHRIMSTAERCLKLYPIELSGDFVGGASMEACFKSSKTAVDKLHKKLSRAVF